MIIAIDDSGDPGLKLGKGSSDYFVIAAVLFENDFDAEETGSEIKRLRQNLKWMQYREFKFRKASPEIRRRFLAEISKCNFKISIVIVDKHNVGNVESFQKNVSSFYNAVILRSIQNFGGKIQNARIIIDGESGATYRRDVKTFFRQNLPSDAIKVLSYRDSREEDLIQLADMIAGAARRSVEKCRDLSYLEVVRKRIVCKDIV